MRKELATGVTLYLYEVDDLFPMRLLKQSIVTVLFYIDMNTVVSVVFRKTFN